jgi:amino acid adenylation domain-containing protein
MVWRPDQPLSDGQRALWFLQRLRPEAAAWNIAAAARARGEVEPARLRRAFEGLARRHEALRLSFHETPDGPVGRLREERAPDFREEDAAGWDEARVRAYLQDEADRPFDLARDPLVRVRLLRTGGDDVILLVIHHLIADLGSLAILVRDLGPFYQSPPLPGRGTREDRERGPGGEGRNGSYWLDRLSGELPVLDLPADRPRPAVRTFRGGSRTRTLGPELTGRLQRLGAEHRAMLFGVLLAGFDVLLHRGSGQTDLLVGSPTSGRLAPELAETVGYLVNPVVLRCDLSGSPTFRQLLERTRRTIFGALRHQDYPFARLVERLQPERDPSRPPVFQVMLAFQRAHLPAQESTGDLAAFALGVAGARIRTGPLDLESISLERHFSQLDLELMAAETSRGVELALTFNSDLFEPATAERLLGHLETLLTAAVEAPDRRIGELPLLTPAEQDQLLAPNRSEAPLPDRLVHELFEEQAARTPDAVAVVGPDRALTYRELSEMSDRMATTLAPGPVAVRAERNASLVVTLLATWKAGAVYLPLNPEQPEARSRRMLELSRALTPGADDLAYVLFTSGSTGEPKGVMVHHRGLVNHLLAKIGELGLNASDRVAQTASASFDISLWQMLAALLVGGRVEIVPDSVVREPARLLAEVESRGITVLELVPSVLGPFLDAMERPPGGLRWMISTGEALPPELARRWLAHTGVPLVNGYGPTECSDRVSHAFLSEIPDGAVHTSIGRPIWNLRLHVLTPDLEEQPAGFPGEVCIGGVGVGRGYLNDPGRTAEAFIPDPWVPGERLYRTGDLGRRRMDGEIEILGRIDHQVKLRGVRIEPGEIEAALRSHPGVREAVVALRGDRLVAWWTGDSAAALREHLKERLPEVMIPSAFRHLEALPLNPNGKVDRRALPDPEPEAAPAGTPGDDLEAYLAEVVGSVLGRGPVGLRESFFDLGGHSLLAAQVAARLRSALGIDPPAGLLFEEPTVAGLSRRVRDLQREAAGRPASPPIVPVSREGRIPLSFAQERLWFLNRLDPASAAYNMAGMVSAGDPRAVEAALTEIVARHEALRTAFPDADGEPYQKIAPPAPVRLPVVDLSALPDPEAEMRRLVDQEACRPFDLARGPLLRVLFFTDGFLFANLHHTIADGWSQEILLRELQALLLGKPLPPLPVQYADYAVWERSQPDALDWWKSELAGELPPLDLPLDRPRPPRQRHRGAVLPVSLPASQIRRSGATPFMVLLAAFQALLHRLTGQDDIRVGAPVANRTRLETEGLIGLFANTVVLRTRFDSGLSFAGLLESVRRTVLGVFPHQDLPFGRLVEELQPVRDPSRTPLFQAMLAVQPSLSVEEIGTGTAKLELTLTVRPEEGAGWIEYDTDLFDRTTVTRWAASLQTLMSADPEMSVADLPLLGAGERAQLLTEWNDTAAAIPSISDLRVHHLFEAQVKRTPDAIALTVGDRHLTYHELNAQADDLARDLGDCPEIGIALDADRSIDMVVSLLAILKSGAFYVPLDPTYPKERLQWMIEDSGARPMLPRKSPPLPGRGTREDMARPQGRRGPGGEGAYTIFTSGSTGRPKGVQVPHRALVNFLLAMAERPGLKPSDTLLAVTTLSFDIAALELLLPLTVGARVVVADRETASDGARLAAEIERVGATVLQATPATWRMLIESGWNGSPGLTALCGGEALPRELARELLQRTAAVWNLYGPTETTVWSAVHRVEEAERTIPVGRPIANTVIFLVDRDLQTVPIGVTGELLIGGAGVARGYAGRPDLTAERFVPGPAGERFYRTGDLARRRPDGTLEILGRLDHQVKVRGFRIELEEVEAALEACPGVLRAVAAVRGDQLVAWVVGEKPGPELARRLPGFMIPSRVAVVDALPLTPNGKVDRRNLPDPEPEAPEANTGAPPSGPVEEAVAKIWRRVLDTDIDRDRNFFELGGHSLLATRVISRINEAFGVRLPLRALFENPTVAGLARLLDGERRATQPIPTVPRGGPLAPSFAQERLWVMDRLSPGNPVYNVSQALDLDGPLDEAALARAFSEVIRRQEALRSRFETVQGRPMIVATEETFFLPVVDVRGLPAEADRLAREDARRPFDLLRGPLLRATLLRTGEESRRLLLAVHHAVCDDGALGVLVREIGALYRGESLPDLPVQYADWADWQRSRLAGEFLDDDLAFWKDRLGGELPVLSLPTDRARPAVQSFRGAVLPLSIPGPLAASLRELSLRHGTTLFMTLLAAFASVLQRASGQDDLVIGTPVAGRDRTEIEGLVGLFVNILPLRLDLSGSPSWTELLARVRTVALEAFEHQELPFEKIVEALQPKRDLGRAALRQAGFSFQDARLPAGLPGVTIRPVPPMSVDPGVSRLDLTLFLGPEEDGLGGFLEYSTDLFNPATAARLADAFRQALEDLAAGRARTPETNLTEGQLLFWFAHRLHPGVQLYFDRATTLFTVEGDLDPVAFSRAFDRLLRSCDVLRSQVREVGGVPLRSVAEPAPFALEAFELETSPPVPLSRGERGNLAEAVEQDCGKIAPDRSPLSPRERGTGGEVSLPAWLAERSARPMDLGERLFDTALLRLSPSRWAWFLSVHHLAADAWTLELLARRLSDLYTQGDAPRFPSYEEYVAAERAERLSEKGRRARDYWERKLSRPAPQNLFYSRPGAPATTSTARLSADLGPEARSTAAALGLFSPSVVFITALFALLHRLSGERRLRIGTPFANRPARFRGTPGLMMNAVPLEVEIDPAETFATLARKVQRETVEASRHQGHPVRNPEGARVYDVYFNYQSVAFRELCGLPVRFELLHSGHTLDRLDVQVSDFGGEGSFRLDLDFNVDTFSGDERERTLGHLLNLLQAFAADPDTVLSDAPLLTPAEHDLLARFNDTAVPYRRGLGIHHLISGPPDAVAVASEAGALTYRELNEKSDRLASWLRLRNAGLVGIRLERSLELMIALVGTLKAGAAYVPLDPGYPADRLALMAEDSGATVVIAGSDGDLPSDFSDVHGPFDEADLAYVIYTSGSTGRPKGVMIPHAGAVNRLLWMQDAYGLTPDDRVLQKTPVSFDVSVWELFWPLIAGARLVMARPGGHQDPAYLISVIVREGITTLHFVPSMLQVFLEQPGVERCRSLKRVICSGEALPEALRRRFHERLPGVELHNLYGPTEASVDVTAWASDPAARLTSVPIGRPIANTRIHILGPHLTPVPPGIPGELCIGGIPLARGYHRRPDLTAEKFVPAPGGERFYRTGDLARLSNGDIEYLGRIDHQVKIRGVRIELGEIEAHLAGFPGVREAVAVVKDGRLAAYYVPEPGWGTSPDQLRGWLRTKLPEVMVPSAFVPLDAMPLTPSGKTDRRALPEPQAKPPDIIAPRTPLQTLVAGVCAEVLGVADVPTDVSFFDLGGNSLMATQVVTLIQEILPVELDLRKVFDGPTVARLAAVIEEQESLLPEPERLAMAEILAELERSLASQAQQEG